MGARAASYACVQRPLVSSARGGWREASFCRSLLPARSLSLSFLGLRFVQRPNNCALLQPRTLPDVRLPSWSVDARVHLDSGGERSTLAVAGRLDQTIIICTVPRPGRARRAGWRAACHDPHRTDSGCARSRSRSWAWRARPPKAEACLV